MTEPVSGDLQRLWRWQEAGGTWRVDARSSAAVTVSLCRCDGGEEVDWFSSSARDVLDYLAGRRSSEDEAADAPPT